MALRGLGVRHLRGSMKLALFALALLIHPAFAGWKDFRDLVVADATTKRNSSGVRVTYLGTNGYLLESGGTTLLVYESQFAGTNHANAATFSIRKDIESLVAALQGKGVKFEQYDLPDTVREGVIHRGQGRSVAWCKDPDGNILCLAQD